MDDILWEISILLGFVLACAMVLVAFFSEREEFGTGGKIFGLLLFLAMLFLIINNYFGNQIIVGTVYAVSKEDAEGKVKGVEFSLSGVKTEFEAPKEGILKAYEVAIVPQTSKKLFILNNDNTIWRLKFHKREIQLQLEPGKTYRFKVHRLLFRKNILDIQEQ